MVKKKPRVAIKKPYMQRFREFEAGICPYCHMEGATLTPRLTKKGEVKGYTGQCHNPKCSSGGGSTNNFTNPKCKERMER